MARCHCSARAGNKSGGRGYVFIYSTCVCCAQELLLAKAWSTDLKKGLAGLLHGQFQSCRSALALAAVPQDVLEPVPAHGLAKQITSTRSKLPLVVIPPCYGLLQAWATGGLHLGPCRHSHLPGLR